MKSQVEFALAHPVYEPMRDMVVSTSFRGGHNWLVMRTHERAITAMLTVNIGME